MIRYPKYKKKAHYRQVVDKFKGYNRNLRIGSGEFSEMENLTSDDYPVLSVRKKRGYVGSIQDGGYATGMLYVPEVGIFIAMNQQVDHSDDEVGSLCLLDRAGDLRSIAGSLKPGPKSLALMGKYLIIAPDMVSVNTDNLEHENIEYVLQVKSGMIYFQMCREDGSFYGSYPASATAPADPEDGDYWMELHGDEQRFRQYSATEGEWIFVNSTCVKVWGEGITNHKFNKHDVVTISGISESSQYSALDGSFTICSVDQDSFVIDSDYMGSGRMGCNETACFEIVRSVPVFVYIVESNNRRWGCSNSTNELFACKLGDFKNWNSYPGISTDSWNVTAGTPGPFTGAAVQNGYPIFYKEHCKHKVWPSATAAHQVTTLSCAGVEKGSEGSLAVCDGTVFYKSTLGVFADDGGGPVEIGQALGKSSYRNGIGAVHDRKYYLSLEDTAGKRALFVFDIAAGMWHLENSWVGAMCSAWSGLYGVTGGDITDLTGNTGTPEEEVSWFAVTGDLGLENPEQKYISRLTLRLSLDPGATLEIYAQYDREQTWVKLGQVYGTDLRSFSLPVRPRRCDQLKLKLQGRGMCKVYSITKTLEKGSELP